MVRSDRPSEMLLLEGEEEENSKENVEVKADGN